MASDERTSAAATRSKLGGQPCRKQVHHRLSRCAASTRHGYAALSLIGFVVALVTSQLRDGSDRTGGSGSSSCSGGTTGSTSSGAPAASAATCSRCKRGPEACAYCEAIDTRDCEAICDCGLHDFGSHLIDCEARADFKYVIAADYGQAEVKR